MKRFLLALAVTAISATGFTQAKITSLQYGERKNDAVESLTFPLVSLADNSSAQKINDYLQTRELKNTSKKVKPANLFDKCKFIMQGDTVTQYGVSNLAYKVTLNSAKLLSVEISGETIAAYPSPFSNYYNFNVQNGELILIDDLITPEGIKKLQAILIDKRKGLIKKSLDKIKKTMGDAYPAVKESLESCNERADEQYFSLQADKIIFHKSGCLAHAMMELEPDLTISLTLKEVTPFLSSFGNKALLQKDADIKSEKFSGIRKPLYGTIDKYPITMQLDGIYQNSVYGSYYYVSQGISIEVSGSIQGNDILLSENNPQGEEVAVFKGKISGSTISGTWTQIKSGKQLAFTVKN